MGEKVFKKSATSTKMKNLFSLARKFGLVSIKKRLYVTSCVFCSVNNTYNDVVSQPHIILQ